MRFRNFLPLIFLILITLPGGLAFAFLWEGYALVLAGAQVFQAVLQTITYRAGMRSGRKNFEGAEKIGAIIYLPLKVNLFLYACAGIPVLWIFYKNAAALMIAHGAGLLAFSLSYLSGLTFIARSRP